MGTHAPETVERFIAAPPEKIFELVADANRHSEIDGSGSVVAAKGTPQRLELGSRFGMSMKIGLPYSMVSTVIEYEENRRIAWQTKPAYPLLDRLVGGRIWRYELEPRDGGTLVRESWDPSQEAFPPLVEPQRGRNRKAMAATLERIEQLATA